MLIRHTNTMFSERLQDCTADLRHARLLAKVIKTISKHAMLLCDSQNIMVSAVVYGTRNVSDAT